VLGLPIPLFRSISTLESYGVCHPLSLPSYALGTAGCIGIKLRWLTTRSRVVCLRRARRRRRLLSSFPHITSPSPCLRFLASTLSFYASCLRRCMVLLPLIQTLGSGRSIISHPTLRPSRVCHSSHPLLSRLIDFSLLLHGPSGSWLVLYPSVTYEMTPCHSSPIHNYLFRKNFPSPTHISVVSFY
jgi:hypothetical protein